MSIKMRDELVYLAQPYSNPSPSVRMYRAAAGAEKAFKLMLTGRVIYAPIAETVFIAQFGEHADTGWDFWKQQDIPKLKRCTELWIYMLPGWKDSRGVRGEVKYWIKNFPNRPLAVLKVEDIEPTYLSHNDMLDLLDVNSVSELND